VTALSSTTVAAGTRAIAAPTAAGALKAPVIVLTHAHSGAARLSLLLARHQDMACSSASGILPLCDQAALAWRNADGQSDEPLSALAAASIRSLATSIVTSILVREGRRRWCEVATAPPGIAETFLQLFPGARVLCLYRALPRFARAAVQASPWGLSGSVFAPFTSAHPGSTVAALTAYWTTHVGQLLAFERAHPNVCRRVRDEDVTFGLHPSLLGFLGLDEAGPSPVARLEAATPAAMDEAGSPFPVGQLPAALLAQAELTTGELGYPPLDSAS
jgi:hypothetical protein